MIISISQVKKHRKTTQFEPPDLFILSILKVFSYNCNQNVPHTISIYKDVMHFSLLESNPVHHKVNKTFLAFPLILLVFLCHFYFLSPKDSSNVSDVCAYDNGVKGVTHTDSPWNPANCLISKIQKKIVYWSNKKNIYRIFGINAWKAHCNEDK